MTIREEVLNLLHTDMGFREEVRRQLLTEEVLGLPALVRELAEAQRRTEAQIQRQGEQIQQLAEQVQRQGEQIQQLVEQVQRQGEQIQQLAQPVQALASWQRGEAGRRAGERYERDIVRRAAACSMAGRGGA